MRPSVEADYDWGRQFLPHVKMILANYLIDEAPAEEDQRHNTDLIVLRLEAKRVAVRIRREVGKNGINYLERYGHQFTIRSDRPRTGAKTELAKVIEGFGDYLVYGFGSTPPRLTAWLIGDLNVFRGWHSGRLARGERPWATQSNGDGSSDFCAYGIENLPPEFVIARKAPAATKLAA